jgi:hypothetical protein
MGTYTPLLRSYRKTGTTLLDQALEETRARIEETNRLLTEVPLADDTKRLLGIVRRLGSATDAKPPAPVFSLRD